MGCKKLQSEQAYEYLLQNNYAQATNLYEEAIVIDPNQVSNYWYLGLAQLAQGNEEEAQATWLLALVEIGEEQATQCSREFYQILQAEAQRQEELENYQLAWGIRQHIREFFPSDVNNLLNIIRISVNHLENFKSENLDNLGLINELESDKQLTIDANLLLNVLEQVLSHLSFNPTILRFVTACSYHIISKQAYIDTLMLAALRFRFTKHQVLVATQLAEVCLEVDPENWQVLYHLANFYQDSNNFLKSLEITRRYQSICSSPIETAIADYLLTRGFLTTGGHWEEAFTTFKNYFSSLSQLAKFQDNESQKLQQDINSKLFSIPFFVPYFQDKPRINRWIYNRLSSWAYKNIQTYAEDTGKKISHSPLIHHSKILNIGFVSHCLRKHSVGWLVRWFFKHYDQSSFKVSLYFHAYEPEDNFAQEWFIKNSWKAHSSASSFTLAEKIYEEQVDILVELDSLSLNTTCELAALKPAPIQVTWLGWDASGVPAIDYFIADPYVLPDDAQEYYRETIWRLPQTYIAVDGFEVGVPTLRRDQLDIPTGAVIYLSAQRGYKRHPDTARLQMKILKEVPNSYFLVKGLGDQEAIQQFFTQLAEEEGIDPDRLRFPALDINEYVHRANLGIADVVLDTYPYNGATTTLETLWMGVPLVTRVGQQFAARNSYAFMMNVGVTEGIAWTDEEYIEWGVRLGKDEALRQQVAWKLKASRQTSPLWNAKQFTRDMEIAFQQMWTKYSEAH